MRPGYEADQSPRAGLVRVTSVVALALAGVVVFGLAIALRSWRTWVFGYCVIALAVTIYGGMEYRAQHSPAPPAEVR